MTKKIINTSETTQDFGEIENGVTSQPATTVFKNVGDEDLFFESDSLDKNLIISDYPKTSLPSIDLDEIVIDTANISEHMHVDDKFCYACNGTRGIAVLDVDSMGTVVQKDKDLTSDAVSAYWGLGYYNATHDKRFFFCYKESAGVRTVSTWDVSEDGILTHLATSASLNTTISNVTGMQATDEYLIISDDTNSSTGVASFDYTSLGVITATPADVIAGDVLGLSINNGIVYAGFSTTPDNATRSIQVNPTDGTLTEIDSYERVGVPGQSYTFDSRFMYIGCNTNRIDILTVDNAGYMTYVTTIDSALSSGTPINIEAFDDHFILIASGNTVIMYVDDDGSYIISDQFDSYADHNSDFIGVLNGYVLTFSKTILSTPTFTVFDVSEDYKFERSVYYHPYLKKTQTYNLAESERVEIGTSWESQKTKIDNAWYGVAHNGVDLFVAVGATGSGNRVMTSSDGLVWEPQVSAANNDWRAVTHGNGIWVAVSTTGTGNRVMTSNNGFDWTIRTSAADNDWRDVHFADNLFVAVASTGTGNRVMTSPDGITWTIRTSAADNNWRSITHGNGIWVAVSNTGTGNRVMTSPDGVTWTTRSTASYQWYGVTYGNNIFVAVSVTGTGDRVMTSKDGLTWSLGVSALDNQWLDVTFVDNLFVAVANTGSGNRVMTSKDGLTWQSQVSAANNDWRAVTCGNGIWVAVGISGVNNRVMTSQEVYSGIADQNMQHDLNYYGASTTALYSGGMPDPITDNVVLKNNIKWANLSYEWFGTFSRVQDIKDLNTDISLTIKKMDYIPAGTIIKKPLDVPETSSVIGAANWRR